MPVQRVSRPDHTFRGFQGQIEAGKVAAGDEVTSLPSGEKARVKRIIAAGKDAEQAVAGQPVSLQLDREIDVSRGCVLSSGEALQVSNMFTADRLVAGRNYLLKLGTKTLPASVMDIKYKVDVNSGLHIEADTLVKNEIACCDISVSDKTVLAPFDENKAMGSFILIDVVTHMTSACGVVRHTLRRADNLTWHNMDITRESRAAGLGQKPFTLWFTGLSGSGKSTLANEVEKRLAAKGRHTMLLDGDNVRMGLNKDLGFTEADRVENIRRIAEVSKLMNDAGLIVLTSFISPYEADRKNAADIIGEECEKRDVKGLYKKARAGEIPNFTGISSEYEVPVSPDITVDTENLSVAEAADAVMAQLEKHL